MATRVNRAATAGNKKSLKSKTRNRTTRSYNTHQNLDTPRNQRVFEAHAKETRARRHNRMAGEEPEVMGFGTTWGLRRNAPVKRVPRVSDPSQAQVGKPKFKKKKSASGRGISGGRIYISASGDRPKPKRSGWSRG